MNPTAFLLFGKLPRPGKVKTRLARSIGDEAAAELAAAFLRDASKNYAEIPGCDPIVAAEDSSHEFWKATFPPPWRIEEQGKGDLGVRLERAFRREFGSHERVAAVGSDHPDLPRQELLTFLLTSNAVWPARDGGYAAILLTNSEASLELFRGIEWSTSGVFAQTVERARERKIELTVGPETGDVDVEQDLESLYDRLSRRRPDEPDFPGHTWRAISRLTRAAARR